MVLTVVLMVLHGRDMCINLMHAPKRQRHGQSCSGRGFSCERARQTSSVVRQGT